MQLQQRLVVLWTNWQVSQAWTRTSSEREVRKCRSCGQEGSHTVQPGQSGDHKLADCHHLTQLSQMVSTPLDRKVQTHLTQKGCCWVAAGKGQLVEAKYEFHFHPDRVRRNFFRLRKPKQSLPSFQPPAQAQFRRLMTSHVANSNVGGRHSKSVKLYNSFRELLALARGKKKCRTRLYLSKGCQFHPYRWFQI